MFAEIKRTLPISGDDYDDEIIFHIKAAALDLTTSAEIVMPGSISISRTQNAQTGEWTVTDRSTVNDELIMTAISLWCNMHIGNPPNIDNLQASYKSLKGQMRLSSRYTRYKGASAE